MSLTAVFNVAILISNDDDDDDDSSSSSSSNNNNNNNNEEEEEIYMSLWHYLFLIKRSSKNYLKEITLPTVQCLQST